MTEEQGFWCQGDCVWIKASDGTIAVEKYRHKLTRGQIGVSSGYPDALRVRDWAKRVRELENGALRVGHEADLEIKRLEAVADAAYALLHDAVGLQECLNPSTYEVSTEYVLKLRNCLMELQEGDQEVG